MWNKVVENTVRDTRHAIRSLLRSPRFAAIAVTTLALGIGVNTVVFSVVNAVLFRPISLKDADRLVMVWDSAPKSKARGGAASYPDFVDWKQNNQVFDEMAAYALQSFNLAVDDQSERIEGLRVSPEMFDVLQVYPESGRLLYAADQQQGFNHVAVITYGLWQRRFGGHEGVIGQSLALDAEVYTIIGILPAEFRLPPVGTSINANVFVPLVGIPMRGVHNLRVMARLKQGVPLRRAQVDMDVIAQQLLAQYPDTNADRGVNLVPVYEQVVGDVRPSLLALLGAASFVLLLSCANVSSLILARAAVRKRELGIRAALGASRWRLVQILLTESILLAVLGGGLGVALALLGTPLVVAIIPNSVPRAQEITLDTGVLVFSIVTSMLAGVVSGLAPALQFSKPNLNEALAEAGSSSTGGFRHSRVRSFLVVSEVALASVLLIGACLLMKSFVRLRSVDPGFSHVNVLTMAISLPKSEYSQPQLRSGFFRRAIEGTKALTGVESVGVINTLPLTVFDQSRSITIEGYPRPLSDIEGSVGYRVISSDYFQVMGIPLLAGRSFTERDDVASPRVAIINDTMASHFWPDGNALGKRLTISPGDNPVEIIGVVASVIHHGLDAVRDPEVYVPYLQRPEGTMFLLVRAVGDPHSLIAPTREQVRSIDKAQPVYNIMTMAERLAQSTASRKFPMLLMSIFAAGAVLIAVTGIYGLASFSVVQRRREIGIRMALGAQPHEVINPILREGMILVFAGLFIGLAGALGLTRVLSSLLFSVEPTDLTTFISGAALLTTVAMVANYVAARKATRVDPLLALHSE